MKIKRVEVRRATIPRKEPMDHARGIFSASAHVFTRVQLEDGTVGYGESAPMPIYSEESQTGVYWTLFEALGPAVLGLGCPKYWFDPSGHE